MPYITGLRAEEYKISGQGANESDSAFKNRVSGVLRGMGKIIEAHEAFTNCLFDQPRDALNDPMLGIQGAIATALQEKSYNPDGMHKVGDDIAAGIESQSPPKRRGSMMEFALLMMMGLGDKE